MKIHYYRAPQGNFGDDLNTWLWDRLLPGLWDRDVDSRFAGIGTLLNTSLPKAVHWIVFGSGAGYGTLPGPLTGPAWNVVCVRGPLTARVLRLPPESAVTDGALLVSCLPEYAPLCIGERTGIAFMPHHEQVEHQGWAEVCRRAGVEFLDPRADSRSTLERIRGCRKVLAEAMHAAVAADALRVPWVPVSSSQMINSFKWLDWTASMDLPYRPLRLPSIASLETIQDRLRDWAGLSLRAEAPDPEIVVQEFLLRQGRRSIAGLALRTARCLGGLRILRACLPGLEERRVDAAAHALRRAAGSDAYLSSDSCFSERREELLRRLEGARRLAASFQGAGV